MFHVYHRIKENESLLEQPIADAFGALSRHVASADAEASLAKLLRPLFQVMSKQRETLQRSAAKCVAAVLRAYNINVVRANAARIAQRLLDIERTCSDTARPDLLTRC